MRPLTFIAAAALALSTVAAGAQNAAPNSNAQSGPARNATSGTGAPAATPGPGVVNPAVDPAARPAPTSSQSTPMPQSGSPQEGGRVNATTGANPSGMSGSSTGTVNPATDAAARPAPTTSQSPATPHSGAPQEGGRANSTTGATPSRM